MERPTLTEENLIKALSYFSNSNINQINQQEIKQAEELLLYWEETNPKLYVEKLLLIIQSALSTTSNETNYYLALSAILSIKVTVKRHWKIQIHKKTKRLVLSDDVKEVVRNSLMEIILLNDTQNLGTNTKIQDNIVSILCTILRMDTPLHSKDMLPKLMTHGLVAPQNTNSIYTIRCYNTAMAIDTSLQELRTKRLSMDKKYIQDVVILNTNQISSIFQMCLSKAIQNDVTNEEIELVVRIIKVMNHCLSTSLPQIFISFKSNVDALLSSTLHVCNVIRNNAICEKYIVVQELEQMIVDVQNNHPMQFAEYTLSYLEYFYLVMMQLSDEENEKSLSSSLLFLGNAITFYSKEDNETNNNILTFYLEKSDQLLEAVLKCMKLKSMQEWKGDSEHYYHEIYDNNDSINAHAQGMYLSLIESNQLLKDKVVLYLTACLSNVDSQLEVFSSCTIEAILYWDTIYTAVGISINHLQSFDINSWFYSCIVQGFARLSSSNAPPILHFRIIWFLGCISHTLSYDNYMHSLRMTSSTLNNNASSQQNDPMLILGTADSIISLLSESEHSYTTNYTTVQSYYANIMYNAFQLLLNQDTFVEYASKFKIKELIVLLFNFNTFATQYLSSHDVVKGLITVLSAVWQQEQDNLIRKDVLVILCHIISHIKHDDNGIFMAELYSIIVPLIENVFTEIIQSNLTSSLEHDAISLFWILIKCSSQNTTSMLYPLYHKLSHFINKDDYIFLVPIMKITHAFLVLDGFSFIESELQHHHSPFCDIMTKCLGHVSMKGAFYIHFVFEALLINTSNNNNRDNICQWLVTSSGFISIMLHSCGMRHLKHKQHESDIVIVQYLTTIARVLIMYPSGLDSLFPLLINDGNGNSSFFQLEHLIKLYFDMFELLSHDESIHDNNTNGGYGILRRKIWVTLLISFIPTNNTNTTTSSYHPTYSQLIMKCMDELLLLCVDVFKNDDGKEVMPFEILNDVENEEEVDLYEESYDEYNTKMRNELKSKDVLTNLTDIKSFLKMRLEGCCAFLGKDSYNELISTVEPVTLRQLERLLS